MSYLRLSLFSCLIIPILHSDIVGADPLDVTFKYSFSAIAQEPKSGKNVILPLTNNISLQSGSQIKFYIELSVDGYLYCYHEDDQGKLTILFPNSSQDQNLILQSNTAILIPESDSWIQLDSRLGKENFNIFLSPNRIQSLDNLNRKYFENHNEIKTHHLISAEISKLKRSGLNKTSERPIQIAVRVRSSSFLFPFNKSAKEVTANGISIESFTVFHK